MKLSNGSTLLHQCARNGDSVGLAYFLEVCGLDANATNDKSESPLNTVFHWQASDYRFQLVGKFCTDILIHHGADPTVKLPHELIVSRHTLDPYYRGIYLTDYTIQIIFKDPANIFSKKAVEKGINPLAEGYSAEDRRVLLKTIYTELGKDSISIKVDMYPEQLGMYCGENNSGLTPSYEAKEYLERLRHAYDEQSQHESPTFN